MDESISNPKPNNRYGLSKLLGEQLVEYEARTYGLEAVVLRPFMVYDENEDLGDHRSAMIRFCSELAVGRSNRGASRQRRSWLHISDAVKAIIAAADVREYTSSTSAIRTWRRSSSSPSWCGASSARSKDLVKTRDLPVAHDGREAAVARPHAHAARRHADASRSTRAFGWCAGASRSVWRPASGRT